jgi:ribosomal protein L37AE/L43A
MTVIGLDLYQGDPHFLPLACPHCGAVQNLALDIEGYWDCDICGQGFIISHARVVTLDEPTFSRAVFTLPDDRRLDKK